MAYTQKHCDQDLTDFLLRTVARAREGQGTEMWLDINSPPDSADDRARWAIQHVCNLLITPQPEKTL